MGGETFMRTRRVVNALRGVHSPSHSYTIVAAQSSERQGRRSLPAELPRRSLRIEGISSMKSKHRLLKAMVMALVTLSQAAHGVSVKPDEMALVRRWTSAKFEGIVPSEASQSGLVVIANNDVVQRNARAGKPLNITGKRFTRGLYCHAVSKVIVKLPGPGKTFSAVVGVDSNDQTSGGRGSVVFSVTNQGKDAFHSDVLREGHAPVPVKVDLNGSTEFTIEVGDAGDGISCDQADWADAQVEMKDGSIVWLGDLPILGGESRTFTVGAPFSFKYGGQDSRAFLNQWKVERASKKLDANRTRHTVTYTDPGTGLVVRCEAVEYLDFPTVEWTLHLKNTGSAETPIISDIRPLDSEFARTGAEEFVLHHNTGSPYSPTDYQPFDTPLGKGASKRIMTSGGRSSNSDLPYFNISWGNEGVIAVIGWPGQWAADFVRDDGSGLAIRAGQELTHFTLHRGEEVRTPRIVLQFWTGDRVRAQNVWRRWMLSYNLPRPFGKDVVPHLAACSSHQFGEMIHADEASQILFVDRYLEEGVKLDYWWMDAGWYVYDPNYSSWGWPHTGTWEVDTKRFPRGLRAITDHAHAKGVKSIVWFEPERVAPGTWLYTNHPEWLLGKEGEKLLNLGNPDALKWLTDHVDKLIVEQGIDLYRNDFNIDPLGFWRGNDAEDRQGITEIRYVEGHLAFWDELRRRHPNMLIDTCASGGRRNDIDSLRRSVPLLRSDFILEPTAQQNHTYGIASWIPFYGTGLNQFDAYSFRSMMCPAMTACYDVRKKDSDYKAVRRLTAEWREIAQYMLGDYYPLTAYSPNSDIWMAWQFDRPDLKAGFVMAFRRPGSPYESARFKLAGLDPKARYSVKNLDTGRSSEITGDKLMDEGITLTLKEQPDSAVMVYKRM